MSVSRLGFVSADGGGGGLNEGEVLALIDQETATFVSNPDPPNVLNNNAIPTLVDPSGRIIKRSKVTITNDDELNTNKLTVGDGSYSFPTTIGAPGQILVVPTLGTELKFLDVDPSPVEVDDLQTKTQNILLPLTTPGQTTFIGNTASVSGLTVGLPDAPDAWNLLPGHGQQGDQLLFPGGDSSDAYWGKAPAITVLESKCQNIDYNLTSPTRTEFVGRVSAENGFGFGESPNTWTIPATRGVTTGQQMLWNNETRETTWGEAPRLTTVYNKALNIGNTVPAVSTAFSGLVAADRFLVGSSPNDWKIGPGQGVYGDSLTWPETGSTAVWSVPPSVQTLQDQCQYMTSEPLGTDFALRVVADSLVSNTSLTLDAENPEGSYILPVTRGTPGQVLVAGGISGDQCVFQNNVLSQNQADSLLEKTQFQATDLTGTTFTGQLTATQNLVAPVVSVGHLVQVNSDSLTGSYILPLNRGTPGQVLVSAGDEGESCEFQDAPLTPEDLKNLENKTQNILDSTGVGNTKISGLLQCEDLFATGPGGTSGLVLAGNVTVGGGLLNIDTDLVSAQPTSIHIATQGPTGVGYSFPRRRGAIGQGLRLNSSGNLTFQDVAEPATLADVVTKTQYQTIAPSFVDPGFIGPIPNLTSFARGIQLRPETPLGTETSYNLPASRSGDAKTGSGFILRTNGTESDLAWVKPIFISRWRRNVPGDYKVPLTIATQEYSLMSTLITERKSSGFIYDLDEAGAERIRYTGIYPVGAGSLSYNAFAYLEEGKGLPTSADITFRLKHFKFSGGSIIVDVRRTIFTSAKAAVSLVAPIYDIDPGDYFRVTAESQVSLNLHLDAQQMNVTLF